MAKRCFYADSKPKLIMGSYERGASARRAKQRHAEPLGTTARASGIDAATPTVRKRAEPNDGGAGS